MPQPRPSEVIPEWNLARVDQLLRHRILIPGLALMAGASALLLAAGSNVVDTAARNLRDQIRSHSASGEVHIVEIDAASLAEIGRWPWSRSIYAAAIDRLREAGVRSIALDVDFSATSEPAEDATLAAALERAGNSVILPTFRQAAGGSGTGQLESVPAKPFAGKGFLAAVNVLPDGDGYVRTMPLGVETHGTPRPSLANMVAEQTGQVGRGFDIDYSINPASIPRHSLVHLVRGRIPDRVLAGKRVMIGATAIELQDRHLVPRHGVIPGVVIQALAGETLLAGPVPQRWSGLWPLLLALLGIAVAVGQGSRVRRMALFGAAAAGVLILPLATEAAFAATMPIAPALAALLTAALLGGAAFLVDRYRNSAQSDAETGLPNLLALEAAAAEQGAINIVVARIDGFATIASGLGPAATASLVLRVADRLRLANAERAIYRIDDASLAWIETPADEPSLEDRIDAVSAVMRQPIDCGRPVDVLLAFGLAAGGEHEARQLAANATLAAQHAAKKGARWSRFTEEDSAAADWRLSLLGELDHALASGQLWNAYQPKLDLRTGAIVGAEALVRWHHPQRGPIEPDAFIPIVEENGRARDLTAYVLNLAIDDALHWSRNGFNIGVAVNVSAALLADHEFIEMVAQILQSSRLPNSRVTIEVTETAAMANPDRAIAALESWRRHGVNISIDDYGTGQSSLGYLQKLPATELKVDKSFVQTMADDPRNAIMVKSTVVLAHELGMRVVAEGIEDRQCLHLLRDMGCDYGQGYFIGRPMSADALADYLIEPPRNAA
jgi:EAL domain-containing protein (putative c-di-GMP-specific phosphodiesterase class I)/CHASE2 domain-containing sensor protein